MATVPFTSSSIHHAKEGTDLFSEDGKKLSSLANEVRRKPAAVKRISIFGLGYVGAVSLACLARDGHQVIGVDIDPVNLDLIRSRKSPILEEGIQEFPGCMVIVSHDRYFLDRVCTKILDLGNYEPGKFIDSV